MSLTDDLLGMSDQDKKDYAESENHASDIERADDEWDIDETCFKDESENPTEAPPIREFSWDAYKTPVALLAMVSENYQIEIDGDAKTVRMVR